jgi:hypothetical protein
VNVEIKWTEHGTVWINITCETNAPEPSRQAGAEARRIGREKGGAKLARITSGCAVMGDVTEWRYLYSVTLPDAAEPEEAEPETSVIVGDVVSFYDCTATITTVGREWVTFVRQDGTTGRKPVDHDFRVIGHEEQTPEESAASAVPAGGRRALALTDSPASFPPVTVGCTGTRSALSGWSPRRVG